MADMWELINYYKYVGGTPQYCIKELCKGDSSSLFFIHFFIHSTNIECLLFEKHYIRGKCTKMIKFSMSLCLAEAEKENESQIYWWHESLTQVYMLIVILSGMNIY